MGEIFHGWRRKAGCVALMMACLALNGWLWALHMPERSSATEFLYGFITLDLTLLSAYLILWKPRKRDRLVNSTPPNS